MMYTLLHVQIHSYRRLGLFWIVFTKIAQCEAKHSKTVNFTSQKGQTPTVGTCLRRCRPAAHATRVRQRPDCIWRCSSPIELLPLAKAARCAGCSLAALQCLRARGEAIWLASTSQVVASHRVWSRMTRRRCRSGAAESDDALRRTRESRRASGIQFGTRAPKVCLRGHQVVSCVLQRDRDAFSVPV